MFSFHPSAVGLEGVLSSIIYTIKIKIEIQLLLQIVLPSCAAVAARREIWPLLKHGPTD